MFNPTERDMARLKGVKPELVEAAVHTIKKAPFKVQVSETIRTKARQDELYAQGRTKPGKVVTWTKNSKHMVQADGFGHAVDLVPIVDGTVPWNDKTKFAKIAELMAEGSEGKIRIRWGGDWNENGSYLDEVKRGSYDGPHFEVA